MAYSGTVVTAGRGRGVVIATGMQIEIGGIAHMVQGKTAKRTPPCRSASVNYNTHPSLIRSSTRAIRRLCGMVSK